MRRAMHRLKSSAPGPVVVELPPDVVGLDVPDWLEYDWNTTSPGLEDPTGTAVFGIFRGVDRRIYIRELY